MLLLDLNKQYPENVSTLLALARFGMQTGQYAKAVTRLEKALQLEPENRKVICLIVQAYEGAGNVEKAKEFEKNCQLLSEK